MSRPRFYPPARAQRGLCLPVTTATSTLTQVPSLCVTSVLRARTCRRTVPTAACESAQSAQQARSHGVRTAFSSATAAEITAKLLSLKSLLAQLLRTACVCARLALTPRTGSVSTSWCASQVGVCGSRGASWRMCAAAGVRVAPSLMCHRVCRGAKHTQTARG